MDVLREILEFIIPAAWTATIASLAALAAAGERYPGVKAHLSLDAWGRFVRLCLGVLAYWLLAIGLARTAYLQDWLLGFGILALTCAAAVIGGWYLAEYWDKQAGQPPPSQPRSDPPAS